MDSPVFAFIPAGKGPRYVELAAHIAGEIRRGRLRAGAKLPSTRALARLLSMHRNTVVAAYRELCLEGLVLARAASGHVVSPALPAPKRGPPVSSRVATFAPQPYEPFALRARAELPLLGGLPDLRLLAVEELSRAYRRALRRHGTSLLGYGDPRGDRPLREVLAAMLSSERGLSLDPEGIAVTRGSQQGLYLAARALLRPGDVVAVERWGYPPAWKAFSEAGAILRPLPVDREGISMEALTKLLHERRVSAVYVTPHHQYPTMVVLSPQRRLELIALARRHRFAIVEDDYDHEFHYEGRPVLPVAATAPDAVVYVGTLSKVLAPGLRLGYVVGPQAFVDAVVSRRAVVDRQGDLVMQRAISYLMEEGAVARHARRVREVYRKRRDHAVALLRRGALPLCFEIPRGGTALWARVSKGIPLDLWARGCQARGVLLQVGKSFDFDRRSTPHVRVGFAALDEQELVQAVRRCELALRELAPARD